MIEHGEQNLSIGNMAFLCLKIWSMGVDRYVVQR